MLTSKHFKRLVLALFGLLMIAMLIAPGALAAGISISPSSGWLGTSFNVVADGFHPFEQVNAWVTRPDSKSIPMGQLVADETGGVEFTVTPWIGWPTGEYIAVAHGKSGLEYSAKFTVFGPETPTPTPPKLYPMSDPPGLTFYYTGAHYTAGELVSAWFHYPDGSVQALPSVYATPWGNVWFAFTVQSTWPYGGYQVSVTGQTSKHTTYMQFSFFDGKITSLVASDPAQGEPIIFSFTAAGFNVGEKVSIWVTGPDGASHFLALATAGADGTAIYSAIIPPGLPQGTYRVVAYGWSSHHIYWQEYNLFY